MLSTDLLTYSRIGITFMIGILSFLSKVIQLFQLSKKFLRGSLLLRFFERWFFAKNQSEIMIDSRLVVNFVVGK